MLRMSPPSTRRWLRRDPTFPGSRSKLTSVGREPVSDRTPSGGRPCHAQARPRRKSTHPRHSRPARRRSAPTRCTRIAGPTRSSCADRRLPHPVHRPRRRPLGSRCQTRTQTRRLRPVDASCATGQQAASKLPTTWAARPAGDRGHEPPQGQYAERAVAGETPSPLPSVPMTSGSVCRARSGRREHADALGSIRAGQVWP